MMDMLLAEFGDQWRLVEAARRVGGLHCRVVDAYTPYPVEGLSAVLQQPASRIRPTMLAGGVVMAALAYGAEYYSAVISYPYDSGGRPLDAWPAFMLVPFSTGILVAAICGFARFLAEGGLPKLSNPLFGIDRFQRASQDRYLLAVEVSREANDRAAVREMLSGLGAISLREVEQ